MRTVHRIWPILTVIIVGLVVISGLFFTLTQAQAQDQDVVDTLAKRLKQQNIPFKEIKIADRRPLKIDIVLQSTSDSKIVAPDDPLFEHAIQRTVALLQKRNITVDRIKVIILNTHDQPIYWSDILVNQKIGAQPTKPAMLDDPTVATLVRDQIAIDKTAIEKLEVSSDTDGVQTLAIKLSVQDIENANEVLPNFMLSTPPMLEKLNAEQGSQIAVYKLEVVDTNGQVLLKYVFDLGMSQQNWWQAEGLTMDWYPHPPLDLK